MNDPRDPQTEDQIRRALSARAQEIDVSPNAFDKIRSTSPTSPWARPAAYAAVAAIVVVFLVGVALLTSPRDDNGGLDNDVAGGSTTVPPDSTAPPTTSDGPSTTSTPPSTSTPEPTGPQSTALGEPLQIDPATGFGLWTNADGLPADQAVAAFLAEVHDLTDLEITPTSVAIADGIPTAGVEAFGVHRRGENGETLDSFAFKVVTHTPENGTAQIRFVLSDEFAIDSAVGVPGGIRVTGRGVAFEGSAVLEAQGMQTLVAVGATELAPFTAVAPIGEHCPCVITLKGTTGFEGAVPSIASYSVNPAVIPTTAATYSVFGVADDDVLNVRSGAGVSNDIITSFPPDATGIILTGNEEMVGSARWVEVETEDARGWVNSQYLVAVPDDAADHRIVEILHDVSTLDPRLFDDVVEFGGIGVYADWPTPWTTVSSSDFDVPRDWSPDGTEDRCSECTATVEEFLGFDTAKWELAEYTAGPDVDLDWQNFFFEVGQFPEFFDRFVTGTIHIPEPNPDVSLDWRRYTVVFDFEDGAPVIRGIWRWGWTP
ncbi:MAG: SH3 domain-containing protein [Acidimicrobiales bacterium]|nr:SH3 domain-containing protein [Acidimicrobiales bacterium]